MKVAAISDVGKVREINEDNYYIYENDIKFYIVADGMGGHKSGEVASAIGINAIKDHLLKYLKDENEEQSIKGIIYQAFHQANKEIYNKSLEDKDCEGMGTTITMALLIDNKLYIGHVGDSRGYILRNGVLEQLTQDHSLVAELVRSGSITEREAMRHPQKNIITRSLGTDKNVKVDIFTLDFKKEDILILCTDGLTNSVDKYELQSILNNMDEPIDACNELISLANKRGGYDNVTALIVENKSKSKESR